MDISIRKREIYKEVEKQTSIIGASMRSEDGNSMLEQIWANEYDSVALDTFWREGVSTLYSSLVRFLGSSSVKYDFLASDNGEILTIKANMPVNFEKNLEEDIHNLCKDFLAISVVGGWLGYKFPEKASAYNEKAVGYVTELRNKLFYRRAPEQARHENDNIDDVKIEQGYGCDNKIIQG